MTMLDGAIVRTLIPYLVAATFLVVLALLRGWRLYDGKVDRALTLFLIFGVALVAGMTDLGTDAAGYRGHYEQLTTGSVDHYVWWEPGFEQLAISFSQSGVPYGVFVFACVLASHLIKFHVFARLTTNTLLAFFVLFCLNLGEVAFVRQFVAASLVLLSFYFFVRHRNVLGVLMMLGAAFFFHKTAIVAGVIVLFVVFGRAALKPLAILCLIAGCLLAVLPTDLLAAFQGRIEAQMAAYTVEGFMQGLQGVQDEESSLFRNYVKFLLYVLLGSWMAAVPIRTRGEWAQRRAAYVVLALSGVAVILIAVISPVFTRLSTYVFPFLALSMRAERFRLRSTQLLGQSITVGLLGANLLIAIYPLAEYL